MTAVPIFYIVELDFPEPRQEADYEGFLTWYASVHAPHLYEGGFTVCTSYRAAAGAMEIVDIYQADDWSIFETPAFARYLRVGAADPYRPPYIGVSPNTRTPYHHVAWRGQSVAEMATPLAADRIGLWRFPDAAGEVARAAEWLAAGGEAALTAAGAAGVRLLRKTTDSPTGVSIRPGGALFVQWTGSAPADPGALLPDWLAEAASATPGYWGDRLYPWPDDASLLPPSFARVARWR